MVEEVGREARDSIMIVNYRYTRHQVARGALADAECHDALYLVKNVSFLRLTYQIRVLAYQSLESGRKLVIRIPVRCDVHPSLRQFQKEYSRFVRIEKV